MDINTGRKKEGQKMVKCIGNWSTVSNQKERKKEKIRKALKRGRKTEEKDTEKEEKCKIKAIQEI